MFFLGICALFQITFLPGFLILSQFKLKKGIIQTFIFSFALSLVFNHLFVIILTHLRINYSFIYYILFITEILLFVFLSINKLHTPFEQIIINRAKEYYGYIQDRLSFNDLSRDQKFQKAVLSGLTVFFLILTVFSFSWAINHFLENIGSVFSRWDSVVSWNRWAVEWYSNTYPTSTKRYAQLIPTNFSVTYSFMRSDQIQFFAKGFTPLFAISILFILLDLGLDLKDPGYIIGIVITHYILQRFFTPFIGSGYVDVPLAFFTLTTVYTLLKTKSMDSFVMRDHYAWLGTIFAAGTALTKQNGLLVFVMYPVLVYFIIIDKEPRGNLKDKLTRLGRYFIFSFLLILPWYVFNEYRIFMGAKTNVMGLADPSRYGGYIPRFKHAVNMIGIYAYLYPFVIITLPVMDKDYRKVVYTLLLPYSLIWGFLFSKFTRNLSISLPLLGLATGLGSSGLASLVLKKISETRITKIKSSYILLTSLVLIFSASIFVPDQVLFERQTEKQKMILKEDVNRKLYAYFDRIGEYKPIFTNYPLQYLPELDKYRVEIGGFRDYDFYKKIRENNPKVDLMLIGLFRVDDRVFQEIQQQIDAGNIEVIFEESRYLFVHIKSQK